MHFEKTDLQQLTPEYLATLPKERRAEVTEQLRIDLMEAQDRLSQNSFNSSRPPSARPTWERSGGQSKDSSENSSEVNFPESKDDDSLNSSDEPDKDNKTAKEKKGARKPGKQKGAKGFGRTQKLEVTETKIHRAECCSGCGKDLASNLEFKGKGGHYTIDLQPPKDGKIGLEVTNTKHIYGSVFCPCGFENSTKPNKVEEDPAWSVQSGENRLVGPWLLSFIIFLKVRMHLTVSKTRELLGVWLRVWLSDGCINTVIREGGRAAFSLEPELREGLKASGLLYVDETGWKEHKVTRWFWAAIGDNIAYYMVGSRSSETAKKILDGFQGWLMTDGYCAYRQFSKRLRCWPHLERKGKVLEESWDKEAANFGAYVTKMFNSLRSSVYKMREQSTSERANNLDKCNEIRLDLIIQCLKRDGSQHEATRKFAVEILNDHESIFRVLKHPELPLSNNTAERALRCWVILRNMCHGSKTEEGSKTVSILASIVDTLRMRKADAWSFVARVIQSQRCGQAPPPLPNPN